MGARERGKDRDRTDSAILREGRGDLFTQQEEKREDPNEEDDQC